MDLFESIHREVVSHEFMGKKCPKCQSILPEKGIKKSSLPEGKWLIVCPNKECDYEKAVLIPLLFRFHCGTLHASMETVVPIGSKQALIDHINDQWDIGVHELFTKQYGHDMRIDWDTYIVSGESKPKFTFPVIGFLNRKPDWE